MILGGMAIALRPNDSPQIRYRETKMKKLSISLCAAVALIVSANASAAEFSYDVTGWQTTCANSYYTGVEGNCLYNGKLQGALSTGVITGSSIWDGSTLMIDTQVAVDAGEFVGAATMTTVGAYFDLRDDGDPEGWTVVASDEGTRVCADDTGTPGTGIICSTAVDSTTLPTHIDMNLEEPTYLVTSMSGTFQAWQNYTLVPEPSGMMPQGVAGIVLVGLAMRRRAE